MLENLKTNNLKAKLLKLLKLNDKLNEYNKTMDNFISYEFPKIIFDEILNSYEIHSDNIIYKIKETLTGTEISINIKGIEIASGYLRCNLEIAGIESLEWKHKLNKNIIKELKKDSDKFETCNEVIKAYIKNNKTYKQQIKDEEKTKLDKYV